jgi:hypothetical protein
MDNSNINPLYLILLYILRCLIPLGIMLGLSYLLRKFGLIKTSPRPPQDWDHNLHTQDPAKGDQAHG